MNVLQTEHVPEWRDEAAAGRYPFEDGARLSSSDAGISLPNDFVLDASVCASFDEVGLYSVTVPQPRDGSLVLTFCPPAADRFITGRLTPGASLVDLYEQRSVVGVLVLSDTWHYTTANWPSGVHRFDHRSARLVPAVVRTGPPTGVEGFVVGGETVSGEVWLVADDGVVIRAEDGGVRIDVTGDPLFKRRRCEPDDAFVTPLFVKTVNGHLPDPYGGFAVSAEPGSPLRVYVAGGELRVEIVGKEGTS